MELEKVENSSTIDAIGYDEKKKIMRVQYKGNATYEYYHILKDEFKSIKSAENVGKQIRIAINQCHPVKSYKKL